METLSSIWIKRCKRKYRLIKHYISGYIDMADGGVKAFYPFMVWAVSKEDTTSGSKRKLSLVVGAQVWPAGTTKNAQGLIIWGCTKKTLCGGVKINHLTGKEIDEKGGCEEGFIPEFKWHRCIGKQGKTNFNNMTMFALS